MLVDKWRFSLRKVALAFLVWITAILGTSYVFGKANGVAQERPIRGSIRVGGEHLNSLAKIDSEEATARVLAAFRAAAIDDIELKVRDGYLVYEVEVVLEKGNLELELLVDAGDGNLLGLDTEDDDDGDDG